MRWILVVPAFLLAILALAFTTPVHAQNGTIPQHPLLQAAQNAGSAQQSVAIIAAAYDNTPPADRKNFAGGNVALQANDGENWLIATDWMGDAPQGAESVKTEGGYGTWLVKGPWSGTPPKGVGIRLSAALTPTPVPTVPNPAILPEHPLISSTFGAESPQAAVTLLLTAFDEASNDNRQNFGEDHSLSVDAEQWWLIATDWGTQVPTTTLGVKTEGGYGVWAIQGPWQGEVQSGVGVKLVFTTPTTRLYLPIVFRQVPLPQIALVQSADDQANAQKSVEFVIARFNDPAITNTKENFDGGKNLIIAEGNIWLIATNWEDAIPTDANPVVTENGYGTWILTGPWEGEIPSGVGILVQ